MERGGVDLARNGAPREDLGHDVLLADNRAVLGHGSVGEALDRFTLVVEVLDNKSQECKGGGSGKDADDAGEGKGGRR